MMRSLTTLSFATAAFLLTAASGAFAATTTIAFDSGFTSLLYTSAAKTTPLTAGNANTNHDGAILQLGYYTAATSTNPFSGTFIALTGPTSLNTAFSGINNTTIGDDYTQGAGDGNFAITLIFTAGSAASGNSLPAAGQILAMQFYNNTTIPTSTAYNVASNSAWTWATPQDGAAAPSLIYSFGNANTVWLGGASTAYYTSIPEPSSLVFGAIGLAGLVWMVRRPRTRGA